MSLNVSLNDIKREHYRTEEQQFLIEFRNFKGGIPMSGILASHNLKTMFLLVPYPRCTKEEADKFIDTLDKLNHDLILYGENNPSGKMPNMKADAENTLYLTEVEYRELISRFDILFREYSDLLKKADM